MIDSVFLLYEEDYKKIKEILFSLKEQTDAVLVFLADQSGQAISQVGDLPDLDLPTLTSLTAGAVAATVRIGELLTGAPFTTVSNEGNDKNLMITIVKERFILGIVYPKQSPAGLVRVKIKKTSEILNEVFENILAKIEEEKEIFGDLESPLPEITEEDIDDLFSDE